MLVVAKGSDGNVHPLRILVANPCGRAGGDRVDWPGMSGCWRHWPRGRGQLGDAIAGPGAQLGQHGLQVAPQVAVQAAAGCHDRGDGRHFRPGGGAADRPPVLASQRQRAKRPCAPVVVPPPPGRRAERLPGGSIGPGCNRTLWPARRRGPALVAGLPGVP